MAYGYRTLTPAATAVSGSLLNVRTFSDLCRTGVLRRKPEGTDTGGPPSVGGERGLGVSWRFSWRCGAGGGARLAVFMCR